MRQERLADPPQVVHLLLLDRHARVDPGVDEQVVADGDHVLEALEEGDILGRDRGAHHRLRLLELGLREGRAVDAVAEHGLAPAVAQEMAEHLEAAEAAQEHLLVVAGEDAHAAPLLPGAGERDHPGAVGAAVDQVAEQDDRRLGGRRGGIVGLDRGDQRFEQVEPAVDVARPHRPAGRAGSPPAARRRRARKSDEELETSKSRRPL